jgi:YD repeat-containing protein
MSANATITIQQFPGNATEGKLKEIRGRVTAKRVTTATRTWDRSGRLVSKHSPWMMRTLLVGYQIDGQPAVRVVQGKAV